MNCVLCEVGTDVLYEIRMIVIFKVLREMALLLLLSWYKKRSFEKELPFGRSQQMYTQHGVGSVDCGSVNIDMQRK